MYSSAEDTTKLTEVMPGEPAPTPTPDPTPTLTPTLTPTRPHSETRPPTFH